MVMLYNKNGKTVTGLTVEESEEHLASDEGWFESEKEAKDASLNDSIATTQQELESVKREAELQEELDKTNQKLAKALAKIEALEKALEKGKGKHAGK